VRLPLQNRSARCFFAVSLLISTTHSRAQDAGAAVAAGDRTMSELLGEAQSAFDSRNYDRADNLFTEFAETYRDEPQVAKAIVRIKPLRALSKLRLKKFKSALPLVEDVLNDRETSPKIRDELAFWRGLCLMQGREYQSAQVAFGEFYRDRKQRSDQRARCHEALLLFGVCDTLMGEHAAAADFFSWQMPRLRRESKEAAARATVMLLYSLLESDNLDLALQFVLEQYADIAEVTQIISFQSLTLELGSRFLSAGEYYNAIICLQRVWKRERLIEHQSELLADLDRKLEILRARGLEEFIFQYDGMRRRVAAELDSFRKVTDFNAALRFRLADAFRELGRYREAALVLEEMLESVDPGQMAARASVTLIQCWMEISRWSKAVAAVDVFVERFAEFTVMFPEVLMLRNRSLHNWGKHEPALDGFRSIYRRFPQSGVAGKALFMQGIVLLKLDRNEEAIALFEDMRRELPNHSLVEDAFYWQGMAYSFASEHVRARDHLGGYLKEYPQGRYRPDAVFRRAFATFSIANYSAANFQLREYLDLYEGDGYNDEARLLLGDSLLAVGEIDTGVASYMRISPSSERFFEESRFKIGKVMKLQGRFADMRAHFSGFISAYPDSNRMAEAVYWIGWAHKAEGDEVAARGVYQDVLRVHGDRHELFGIADVLDGLRKLYSPEKQQDYVFEMGRLVTEAKSQEKNTLELHARWAAARAEPIGSASYRLSFAMAARLCDPTIHNPRILADCADYLLAKEDLDKADNLYSGLRKWNPRCVERDRVYLGRASIALSRGNPEQALQFLRRIEDETPYSGKRAAADLLISGIFSGRGENDAALDVLDKLLSDKGIASSSKAEALFRSAEILTAKGDKLKATAYFERVYVVYGKFRSLVAKSYLRRGELLEELGRPREAVEVYRALLERDDLSGMVEHGAARRRLAEMEEDTDA
jgi:tetratricopeptide (TPR) repeat protein